ncbi:hypothetical protein QFZ24_003238 [Streptomyces phaeochromogenes]|uniref:hypothetical protein n=1 Tax=Streptomyces phaeochromogenes TaxID=1923 RepID=UPI002791D587|nr:hypothetical protein [Streptomyces phaeochromogenes]MDQ0949315.1 hypothetical protein [Streptomyces phaeochromogenes]
MTEEQPATPPAIDPEQLCAALCAWAEAVAPAVRAAAQALAKAAEAARAANQDDYALAPPRPASRRRPAWQSPYGPAHTRRRKH